MKLKNFIFIMVSIFAITSAQAQWSNGNNAYMTGSGYTCQDLASGTVCDTNRVATNYSNQVINTIGYEDKYATLNIKHALSNYPIQILGENYLNINIDSTGSIKYLTNGTFGIYVGNGSVVTVLNGDLTNSGELSRLMIANKATFNGDIINNGKLANTTNAGGNGVLILSNGSTFNGNIINNIGGEISQQYSPAGITGATFNGSLINYGTIKTAFLTGYIEEIALSIRTSTLGGTDYIVKNLGSSALITGKVAVQLKTLTLSKDQKLVYNEGTIKGNEALTLDAVQYITFEEDSAANLNFIENTGNLIRYDLTTLSYGLNIKGSTIGAEGYKRNILNSGLITGSQAFNMSTTTLYGDIVNTGNNGKGILSMDGTSGSAMVISSSNIYGNIVNNGDILAKSTAISITGATGALHGKIINSGEISGGMMGINIQSASFLGSIENSGTISTTATTGTNRNAIRFYQAQLFGTIKNESTGIITSEKRGISIELNSVINESFKIINEGTITGNEYSIYNAIDSAINYQGNGTINGDLYSEGGFIFSDMNRGVIENVVKGDVTYQGTNTQLNIEYADDGSDMIVAKITNLDSLSLLNIYLNIDTLSAQQLTNGHYLIASSLNGTVSFNGISLMENGILVSNLDYLFYLNEETNELWLNLRDIPTPPPAIDTDKKIPGATAISSINSVRRLGRNISNNQMVRVFQNNIKNNLKLSLAQSNQLMTDFFEGGLYQKRKNTFWMEYYTGSEKYASQGNIAKFSNDYQGVVMGYDYQIKKLTVGGSIAYDKDTGKSVDYKESSHSYKGSLYASLDIKSWFILGNIGYASVESDNEIQGDGDVSFFQLSAGKVFVGKHFVGDIYTKYDSAIGKFEDNTTTSNILSIGGDLKYVLSMPVLGKIVPTVFYELGYELSDGMVRTYDLNPFTASNDKYELGNLIHSYGVRLQYIVKSGSSVYLGYEGQSREDYSSQEFRFGAALKF